MATTYEAIATVTVGSGGAANIEFTSIPGTYTDLHLVISARAETTTSSAIGIYFNGSTGSNDYRRLSGDGSAASSDSATSQATIRSVGTNPSSYTANTFGSYSMYIPNYAGSNNKSVSVDAVTENNATDAAMTMVAGIRNNTAAITSITCIPNSGDFNQYSTATLYGIKNS